MLVMDGDQVFEGPFVHEGDLTVNGRVTVSHSLVVTGSLVVVGLLSDTQSDCRITVAGDLSATGVFVCGDLLVSGDITADVLYCVALHLETLAGGMVRARLVMEDDYRTAADRLDTEVYVDLASYDPDQDPETTARLRGLLVDEVFESGHVDYRDLFDRMLSGEPVLRSSRPIPATEHRVH